MEQDQSNTCSVRMVASPDGTDIPIPSGGVGLATGMVTIRDDAEVQIHPKSENGYYVVVNNADPSNNEAADLYAELTVEGSISALERLAVRAFGIGAAFPIAAAGLASSVLVSLFTSSNLTREVFIRAELEDGTPITYLLLV